MQRAEVRAGVRTGAGRQLLGRLCAAVHDWRAVLRTAVSRTAFPKMAGLALAVAMATSVAVVGAADAVAAEAAHAAADRPARPNVLVIMADDLGFGDVSCYGATAIETPHIDALAAGGLRFTSGYCSASTCTPTRYSFLTGTYAFRGERTGIAPPNSPAIIQQGTATVASLLHEAGYETAVIGKWHLGLGGARWPRLERRAAAGAA